MNSKYWQPMKFGEKQADEVSAYIVGIPNLPLLFNKKIKKFLDFIESLDGYIGLRPEYPYGTLLIFDTKNHAKVARNMIKNYRELDVSVGNDIGEVYIPKTDIERLKERK